MHDEYRPTGYSRTYPNLMTQEGIAGDETRPTNQQTLTMNAASPRELRIPLDFLDPQQSYVAHIYSHDPDVPTRTHVRVDQRSVDRSTVLTSRLDRNGGQAVWVECQ